MGGCSLTFDVVGAVSSVTAILPMGGYGSTLDVVRACVVAIAARSARPARAPRDATAEPS